MPRQRIILRGRVQGVGFRYFAVQAAREAGVTGWARNLRDRSVEIEAQGGAEALGQFVDRVRRGPRFGRVDDVDIDPLDEIEGERDFDVRF